MRLISSSAALMHREQFMKFEILTFNCLQRPLSRWEVNCYSIIFSTGSSLRPRRDRSVLLGSLTERRVHAYWLLFLNKWITSWSRTHPYPHTHTHTHIRFLRPPCRKMSECIVVLRAQFLCSMCHSDNAYIKNNGRSNKKVTKKWGVTKK